MCMHAGLHYYLIMSTSSNAQIMLIIRLLVLFVFYLYQIYQYIISVNTTTSTKNNHFTIVSLDHMILSLGGAN